MRLKLDPRARRVLARIPVVNVYSGLELLLIAGLAVQGARLAWALTTPVSPLGDWRPAELAVPGRPADILTGFDPFFRLEAQQAPAAVTTLQLTLFGIRVNEASGGGSAIVAGPDGVQRSVAVGEELQPGVVLKSVSFDHITVARGAADEDLFMVQSDAPPPSPDAQPPTPGAPPSVDAGVPVGQLRNEIGFIPRIDGGRVSGLVVRPQGTGAAFRQAGLREGDVLTSIGGRPVSGPDDIDRIARDFAKGGNVPITVERGTATLPLSLTIAPPK